MPSTTTKKTKKYFVFYQYMQFLCHVMVCVYVIHRIWTIGLFTTSQKEKKCFTPPNYISAGVLNLVNYFLAHFIPQTIENVMCPNPRHLNTQNNHMRRSLEGCKYRTTRHVPTNQPLMRVNPLQHFKDPSHVAMQRNYNKRWARF